MRDWSAFENLRLRAGFIVARVRTTDEPLIDAIGREAVAQTSIIGRQFAIVIRAALSDEEVSISLYHEVLEAATVAALIAPAAVVMFNEADFERAARLAHDQLGPASPENLDRMLQSYGFSEQ